MGLGDAYRVIGVVRQAVEQETKSGARIEYVAGQVATSSGYVVSAYLLGSDTATEDFRVPAHLHVNAGDYAQFAIDHARGSRWLVEVIPNSIYSKLSIDVNNGVLYLGDGTSVGSPIVPGSGGGGSGNLDGGAPDSTYGGTTAVDGGTP